MIEESIQKYLPEDLIPRIMSYKKIHQIPYTFDKYKSQIQKEKAMVIQRFMKKILLRNLAYEWFYYKAASETPSKTKTVFLPIFTFLYLLDFNIPL